VYDRFTYNRVPREVDGSPQTCENCAWELERRTKMLPAPARRSDRTWHELAFLYAVARLYLSEYKKAKRQRRL
jgi:hypothetical protein